MRLLLLGGTAEARELAARLHPRVHVISSLAGRVPDPVLPPGEVRTGGFGGVEGLRRWLLDHRVDAVVDATHPYAATMTAHAAEVCAQLDLPHLVLHRPPWETGNATIVGSDTEAAAHIAAAGYRRVLHTAGRSGVAAFRDSTAWLLIRVVTAPDPRDLPAHHELIFSRGPYTVDDERALIAGNRIDVVVTKNSGGEHTRGKIDAARALGVDVVMIARPPLPGGVNVVDSVAGAEQWVLSRGSGAE